VNKQQGNVTTTTTSTSAAASVVFYDPATVDWLHQVLSSRRWASTCVIRERELPLLEFSRLTKVKSSAFGSRSVALLVISYRYRLKSTIPAKANESCCLLRTTCVRIITEEIISGGAEHVSVGKT
jgi:hypothetical protein